MSFLKKVLNFSAERYLKTAGDLFIYDGDYESALHMVEKTLEIEPQDVRALVLRGDILYCLNRDTEALDTFNQVLQLDPHNVEAWISKAGVLDVLANFREALDCCEKAFMLIQPHQSYLLPTLFDQNLSLLIRLKKHRQAHRLMRISEKYLANEEYQYLMGSYHPMLERVLKTRKASRQKAQELSIRVIK